jgi:hypothetical protein
VRHEKVREKRGLVLPLLHKYEQSCSSRKESAYKSSERIAPTGKNCVKLRKTRNLTHLGTILAKTKANPDVNFQLIEVRDLVRNLARLASWEH